MAKQNPKLRLVSQLDARTADGSMALENAVRVVSLGELSSAERGRVERIVAQIAPKAGIIGVAVTPRSWDLRPIVLKQGEANPSIIRFLGPEVTLSVGISARVHDLFRRFGSYNDLNSRILETGTLEGQIWYRREYIDKTLADLLQESPEIAFQSAAVIAKNLLGEIDNWHARGFAHGHIVAANICLAAKGDITLLDGGVGLAVVQASRLLALEDFPKGYVEQAFAPESTSGESVLYSADIYGLGIVFYEIFSRVPETGEHAELLGRMLELCDSMMNEVADKRPGLAKLQSFVGASLSGPGRRKQKQAEKLEESKASKTTKGRIVSTASRAHEALLPEQPEQLPAAPEPQPVAAPKKSAVPTIPVQPLAADPNARAQHQAEQATPRKKMTPQAMRPARKSPVVGIAPEGVEAATEFKPEALEAKPTNVTQENGKKRAGAAEEMPFEAEHEAEIQAVDILPELEAGAAVDMPRLQSLIPVYLSFLCIVLACSLYYFYNKADSAEFVAEDVPQDMRLYWESGQPSRMAEVARVAVAAGEQSEIAEMLVVNSAMQGRELGPGVNIELLRVAYDKRWEAALTEGDRRTALSLALSGLLGGTMPKDLPAITDLHPGIVLAITATTGDGAEAILSKVPTVTLMKLPPPFAPAFQALLDDPEARNAGAPATRLLARLSARGVRPGIDGSEEVVNFLAANLAPRLRALALLFSQDDLQARRVLDLLLNHPNLKIEHPIIEWGELQGLISWNTITPAEQLLVLSGIAPAGTVSQANIAQMFAHPDPEIRSYAVRQALDRITWTHPGAYEVLSQLKRDPTVLSARQTLQLGRILDQPAKVEPETVRGWLESEPPTTLVEALLLGTHKEKNATKLDFELARFLYRKRWAPSLDILSKLTTHPDRFSRFVAYSKIFALEDQSTARSMLQQALKTEQDPEYRNQIQLMLEGIAE